MLIVFAGLPGVGKSTLARSVSKRLGATYLRIDSIEAALAASPHASDPVGDSGYRVAHALAEDNLALGRTVIADAVNPVQQARDAWLSIAERAGCVAVEIEVICSDAAIHKARVERRHARFPDRHWPTWQDVMNREYHRWDRDRMVVDTAIMGVEIAARTIVAKLMKAF